MRAYELLIKCVNIREIDHVNSNKPNHVRCYPTRSDGEALPHIGMMFHFSVQYRHFSFFLQLRFRSARYPASRLAFSILRHHISEDMVFKTVLEAPPQPIA